MRATLRWAHSDLRTYRGEALFLVLATAGIVASLLLATALFGYATNPWQRVFTQARGAPTSGCTPTAPPIPASWRAWPASSPSPGPAPRPAPPSPYAAPVPPSSCAAPPRNPRWGARYHRRALARPGRSRRVVLESRLARALLAQPGDTLALPGTAPP